MNRIYVSSSDLKSIGYDPNTSILEIEFKTGAVYQYSSVPYSIYQNLMNSSSKGKYFHSFVKRYPCRRVQ